MPEPPQATRATARATAGNAASVGQLGLPGPVRRHRRRRPRPLLRRRRRRSRSSGAARPANVGRYRVLPLWITGGTIHSRLLIGGAAGHWWSYGPPSGPTISNFRSHNFNQFHQFKTIPNKNNSESTFDTHQSTFESGRLSFVKYSSALRNSAQRLFGLYHPSIRLKSFLTPEQYPLRLLKFILMFFLFCSAVLPPYRS